MITEGFSLEQVEKAKSAWIQKRKSTFGDESEFVSTLVDSLYDGQDFGAISKFDEKIKGITQAQATAAIRKYVDQSKLIWAVGKGE